MSGGTETQPCSTSAAPSKDRPAKRKTLSALLASENPVRAVVIFLAIISILAIRSRHPLLLPTMAFEDGRDMLAYFFNDHSIRGIMRLPNGYVMFLPNLIAWLSVGLLPLPAVPYAFGFASLAISSSAFYLLTRPGHAWLIPNSNARTILALTLAILPLGKDFLVTNLTYSQWIILFILLLLVTRRPLPDSIIGLSLWVLCVAACAMTNPLSILILPFVLVPLGSGDGRRQKRSMAIVACVLILYQIFGVNHHAVSVNLSMGSVAYAVEVFLARVAFETFFGTRATNLLITNGQTAYVCAIGIAVLMTIACMTFSEKRRARALLITSTALWFSFSIVLLSVLTRYNTPATKAIYLKELALQRYFYVGKIITVVICAWQLIPRIQSTLANSRWPRLRLGMTALIFSSYVFAVTQSNVFLYDTSKEEGLMVKAFLASAYSDLARCKEGAPYEPVHILRRQWTDVVLDLDRHTGKSSIGAR